MPLSAAKIVREILFVPPSMPAIDLLAKMQATRIHLALVIDEYGGTDGLVSIEDMVEQIVGDIEDEHDEDETPAVVRQTDGSFLADARAQPRGCARRDRRPEFDVGDAAKEVDTLGGYLVMRAGRVPVRGELVPGPGRFEIEVLDADPRRVKKREDLSPQGPPARRARRDAPQRDAAVRSLAPPATPSKLPRRPTRTLATDAVKLDATSSHAIVLAWGWRRAADRVRRRRRRRRWRWRRSTPGRCCSSPFRSWSG